MASANHDLFGNEDHHYDIEQWTCGNLSCLKNISSFRPPVYNSSNCSCADLGNYADGFNVPQPATTGSPMQGYQFEDRTAVYCQPPQSYASSTTSVLGQEGVEREDPNLDLGHTYLPLGPDMGLNEIQHRRSASVHSDMSFQMRRFLLDQQKNMPRPSVSSPPETKFLRQDLYIQSQNSKKPKDRMRCKPSHQSSQSTSSEEYGFIGERAGAVDYIGGWIEDDRDGNRYSLTLSGMTDELSGK